MVIKEKIHAIERNTDKIVRVQALKKKISFPTQTAVRKRIRLDQCPSFTETALNDLIADKR